MLANAETWLSTLPEPLRRTAGGVAERILRDYPDTLAIAVIGSAGEGVHDQFSDVDVFYLRNPIIPKEGIVRIKADWPLAHFIAHTPEKLRAELDQGSIAVWSLKRGRILHDAQGVLARLLEAELPLPTPQWRRERVEDVAKWPSDAEGFWRKLVNLGVLWLAGRRIVATTKHQLRADFTRHNEQPLLRAAVQWATTRGPKDTADFAGGSAGLMRAIEVLLAELRVL
jgi:hypothetical protein